MSKRPSVVASVWLTLFCVTAILGGSAVLSQAPPPPQAPDPGSQGPAGREAVAELRIVGNDFFPVEKIVRHIHTRAGRPYDPEVVAEDVRRLMHTRMFVSVDPPTIQRVPAGLAVTFRVHERRVLKYVKFVGCEKVKCGTLQKEIGLKEGDPFDPYAVTDGQRKIVDYYKTKGFPKAFVTIHEGDREGDKGVIYVIDEGPKARHLWTDFVGNTFAGDSHLRTLIKSKPGVFWVFGGNVDLKQIEEDRIALEAYYHSMGFWKARVGRVLQYTESENWLTLTYVIDEGPRFMVRDVRLLGNRKFSNEQLTKDLKLTPGRYFNRNEMAADQVKMQDIYGADGYVFADAKGDVRFLPDHAAMLDIVYNVVEGGRYRVGKINVKIDGEYPHTRITTVLNRMSIHPGEIIDVRDLRASERRLKASQLFAVDPARNVMPRIAFTRPAGERRDDESELAEDAPSGGGGNRRRGGTYRGQSPEPQRYEAFRPTEWTGPEGPIYDVDVDIEGQWNPNYPGRDEEPREPVIRGQSPDDGVDPLVGSGTATLRTRPLVPVDRVDGGVATGGVPLRSEDASPRQPAVGTQYAAPISQNPVPSAQYAVPSTQYAVPSSRYPLPSTERTPANAQYLAPGADSGDAASSSRGSNLRWLNREHAVYRGQGGTYDPNDPNGAPAAGPPPGYPPPTSPPAGYPGGPPPAAYAPGLNPPSAYGPGTYQPGVYAPGVCPPGTVPASAVPPGPAGPLMPPPGYMSRPEGRYAPQGQLGSPRSTLNDAGTLLGTLPNEEPLLTLPLEPTLEETTTGRLIFSVGVNSDLGVLGSIVLDEQNFDPWRWPHSWDEVVNGQAFRGGGDRLRIEASPGTQLQRYTISYTNPYLMDTQYSMGLSAYYFDRAFTEWTESHGGGRIMLGRQLIPDLSASVAYRLEDVRISNPIVPPTAVPGIPALNEALGSNTVHGLSTRLTHDTRDNQFLATEGYLLDMGFEQVLGSFQYPRADVDLRKYFLLHQHPDGSGRHVLSLSQRVAITGNDTPIYDRYFIGGFTTLRGFAFREASPRDPVYGVTVGGNFSTVTSAEYMFPITADDTLRGVLFCDSGVVEPSINHWHERYRAAVGFGLRITIPAMGPAPIALDFAFPVSKDPLDQTQVFSFFVGFLR